MTAPASAKVDFTAIFELIPVGGGPTVVSVQQFRAASLEDAGTLVLRGTSHQCQNPYGKGSYTLGRCSVSAGHSTRDAYNEVKPGAGAFGRHLEIRFA